MQFLYLLFAHCLADFPLQGEWLAKNKGSNFLYMLAHVTIWTGSISLAMQFIGSELTSVELGFLFLGHLGADWIKCDIEKSDDIKRFVSSKFIAWIDQCFHIYQLLIVYLF